ncbi:MAG: bifunctional pyr operon transcriptional regulator/uracil phosphoribosyltransferase PyrR [Spirochaetia bacterium]
MTVILDDKEVTTIIERLAIDIFQHTPDMSNLVLIGIQSRGDKIAERLIQLLEKKMVRLGINNPKIPLGVLNINFYRDDLKKNHEAPKLSKTMIDFDINSKHVILVDDVFYTGRTVRAALDAIFEVGRPARIAMLTLINRTGRELPVLPEFIGLHVNVKENEYVKVQIKEIEGQDLVCVMQK